jgi:hypothetical protein
VVWFGLWLLACSHWLGLLLVIAPVYMTNMLVRHTGKKLLEKHMARSRGTAYADYVRRTSGFVPWPPRPPASADVWADGVDGAGGVGGAYMSYWIYQHLGNLSPDELGQDELWRLVQQPGDAAAVLRDFAARAERQSPGIQWSFRRSFGRVRVVVIDSRSGRVLEDGRRLMVSEADWRWVTESVSGDWEHVVLATSLPLLLPPGIHALEAWNEAVCDGAWVDSTQPDEPPTRLSSPRSTSTSSPPACSCCGTRTSRRRRPSVPRCWPARSTLACWSRCRRWPRPCRCGW